MLIELQKVSLELGHRMLLEDVSLAIAKNSVLQICGANGSGKSTLLKLLAGQHWHSSGTRTYFFTDPPRSSPIGAKEQIALVSPELQERYQRLGHDRLALEVLETGFMQTDFLNQPLEPHQQTEVQNLARALQISHLLEQSFIELSKGQMRQVLLARALLVKPRLLLLDEFFSGVDAVSKERLKAMVRRYLESGGSLVYTTHRQEAGFAAQEKQLWLENGKIHRGKRNWERGKPKGKSLRSKVESQKPKGKNRGEVLLEVEDAFVWLGQPRDDATAMDGNAASERKLVLKNIQFTLSRGLHWLVTGHNGAGKSTFAKLLCGDVAPAVGGLVRWFGKTNLPIWERHRRIALVSSDLQAWHRVDATGFEIVASGFVGGIGWHHQLEPVQIAQVHMILSAFEIEFLAERNALYASQGELRKLLLARALVTQPEIMILDEAFDYLDAPSRALVWNVLEQQGITLLVIAHRDEDHPPFEAQHLELRAGEQVKKELLAF